MRHTTTLLISPFVVCAFVLAASSAHADEETAPHDPDFELEAQLGYPYGMHMRAGVILDAHAVLSIGLIAHHSYSEAAGYEQSSRTQLAVPLEIKVYFADPSSGGIVPMARAGLLVGWESMEYAGESDDYSVLGGTALVGAAYFPEPAIGLELEMGGAGTHADSSSPLGSLGGRFADTRFDAVGRVGLVLRL